MADVLVIFGFTWMVVGALIGLYVGARHEPHLEQLEEIAKNGSLLEYHRTLDAYKWKVTVHAHSMLFALVTVAIGLVMPKLTYSETVATALSGILMLAPVVWSVGGWRFSKPIMAVGDLLLLLGLVTTVVGLAKTL